MDKPRKGKIIATIECRMTSTRLPGKVLMDAIDGKSMLEIMVERVKRVSQVSKIVLATTINKTDDVIEELAKKLNVNCFRGSEEDVLARVTGATKKFQGDIIVELTGDCPLIDPEITSQVIDSYLYNKYDYVSNGNPVTYPIGMDTQVFSLEILKRADQEGGSLPEDREHVTWYIVRNPDKFSQFTIIAPPSLKYPDIAVCLDEKNDYELIKEVLKRLYPKNKYFSCYDIIELFKKEPELLTINKQVKRKELTI